MRDSEQGSVGSVVPTDPLPDGGSAEVFPEPGPSGRSEGLDRQVEELRVLYASGPLGPVDRLEHLARSRFGLAHTEPAGLAVTLLIGIGLRLGLALAPTIIAGQWAAIPWGRWAVVLACYGVLDLMAPVTSLLPDVPPRPWIKKTVEDWTALLPAIVRESDLRDMRDFVRRWDRLWIKVAVGAGVAGVMLSACVIVAPGGFDELTAGTIVLLALVLYDFGAIPVYQGNIATWAMMAREARYEHDLFWPSPADSPEIRKTMRRTTTQGSAAGGWITMFLVLTVVLVPWSSPLVLPLAVGFVVIGYLSTIGLAISNRASVRKIVERVREERLAGLRRRIEAFGPHYTRLSSEESAQLRNLMLLYDRIRDAPAAPTTTHTVVRTAAGLIVPTLMFLVTVFGEVSAERILDAILP